MKVRCILEMPHLTLGKIYPVFYSYGVPYITTDDGEVCRVMWSNGEYLSCFGRIDDDSPMTYEELENLHKKVSEASTIKIGSDNKLTFNFGEASVRKFELRYKLLSKEELLELKKITEQLFPGE